MWCMYIFTLIRTPTLCLKFSHTLTRTRACSQPASKPIRGLNFFFLITHTLSVFLTFTHTHTRGYTGTNTHTHTQTHILSSWRLSAGVHTRTTIHADAQTQLYTHRHTHTHGHSDRMTKNKSSWYLIDRLSLWRCDVALSSWQTHWVRDRPLRPYRPRRPNTSSWCLDDTSSSWKFVMWRCRTKFATDSFNFVMDSLSSWQTHWVRDRPLRP